MDDCIHDPLCLVGHYRFFQQGNQINQTILKGLNLGHLKTTACLFGITKEKGLNVCFLVDNRPSHAKNTTRYSSLGRRESVKPPLP